MDLLFEIDPRQYEAALDKAKTRRRARASHSSTSAPPNITAVRRSRAQNASPQKQLDADKGTHCAKAELVANGAAQQNAELNLAWTKVYSPVAHRRSV